MFNLLKKRSIQSTAIKGCWYNFAQRGVSYVSKTFQGYQLWLKAKGVKGEDREPITGLTNDQIFFVGFANVRFPCR